MSDFDKLWAGQTVSLLGSAFTVFALPVLAVLVLHATPLQVGTLGALQAAPFPVLGMLVGVLADRVPRGKIMMVANLVRCLVLAMVPLAAALHVLRMPQLYVVALVTGSAAAFFGVAYQSYLPLVVPSDRLTDANAKLELSSSGSTMLGSALAGTLVQTLGAPAAIGIDALSYVVSVSSLALIRLREPAYEGLPLTLQAGLSEMLEGVRLVFGSQDLRWLVLSTGTVNFGGAMVNAVVPTYFYTVLHLSPQLIGIVYGFSGLGFVGALLSKRVRARLGLRVTLAGALLVYGAATACMLFARAAPYVVLALSDAAVAISITVYNVHQVSYRQALTGVRIQGRMNATMRTFVAGAVPLGSLAGGYLGSSAGSARTIFAGALLAAASALWVLPLRERQPGGMQGAPSAGTAAR